MLHIQVQYTHYIEPQQQRSCGLTPHRYTQTHMRTHVPCLLSAAQQAVQDALPEGWTLLTSLHLLGVDGVSLTTTTQRGCKFEADILVLNEQGVAVAIVEGEQVLLHAGS